MSRMDVKTPRERKDGKTYWHKVGAAFPTQSGGWSIVLDSLPLPDKEGRVAMILTEPYDANKDFSQGMPQQNGGRAPMQDPLDEDEIPFAPEFR